LKLKNKNKPTEESF